MDSNAPNVYTALIALITVMGNAFAIWIANRAQNRKNEVTAVNLATKVEETAVVASAKLDQVLAGGEEVKVAVNGNLDREKKKVAKYAKLLRQNGIEPDDTPDEV